ncbi:MAG: HNH endonuclease domain-containing protein [Clostridia bacterium]
MLESQDGRDIYSNEELDREQVISNPSYCDIDHIIPYSISFDNSVNNIVLTLNKHNKEKGQKTPFQYLEKGRYHFLKANL